MVKLIKILIVFGFILFLPFILLYLAIRYDVEGL